MVRVYKFKFSQLEIKVLRELTSLILDFNIEGYERYGDDLELLRGAFSSPLSHNDYENFILTYSEMALLWYILEENQEEVSNIINQYKSIVEGLEYKLYEVLTDYVRKVLEGDEKYYE